MADPEMKSRNNDLVPPDAGLDQGKQRRLPFWLIVVFTLFIILDVAVLAYWLLPGKESKQPVLQEVLSEEAPALSRQEPPVVDIVLTEARIGAEEQLGLWLRLQARAEAENVALWGSETYVGIVALVAQGDTTFAEEDFAGARESYEQAEGRLQTLLASKPELFAAAMDQGRTALQKQDSESAVRSFELALTLEPGSAEAGHGLQRARSLDQVILLHREGLQLEKKGLLAEAQLILLEASELDPEFLPVIEALARVETELNKKAFQRAMSGFFGALDRGDLSSTRSFLQKAATIRPSEPVLADAAKQLDAAEVAARLSNLEKKFNGFTAGEQWQKALQVCEQALQISPQSGFAVKGAKDVRQRIALDKVLQSILARPQRLQEDGPLAEAVQILELARSMEAPGPRLTAQIASLDQLLVGVSTEVDVILRSDDATDVVVYRVGRLGEFLQKQLQLRPGTYTIVGTRSGFRDVRHTFSIRAGQSFSLFISCEEPI